MRMYRANVLLILVSVFLLSFSVYNVVNYQSWSRYYYGATAIAPSSYPVSVRDCYFTTPDLDEVSYVTFENVNNQNSTWRSNGDTIQLPDKQLLPEKLCISYFSYREKKFYRGTLKLPTKRVEQIFKDAIRDNKTEKHYRYRGDAKGLTFVVGIANNGKILIWVRGIYFESLILKAKINTAIPSSMDTFEDKDTSTVVYIERIFNKITDSTKLAYKNGYDSPANYADSITHYIENNRKRWERERKNELLN